jgi:hypothetical protein
MFPWKQLNILKFPYLLIGADDDRWSIIGDR